MPDPFRAVFEQIGAPTDAQFDVAVVGYRMTMRLPVHSPEGIPHWFVFLFYDRLEVVSAAGPTQVSGNTMLICPPRHPIGHRTAATRPFVRSWIRCSGSEVSTAVAEAGLPPMTPLVFGSHVENERHLLAIHAELSHPRGTDPRTVQDLFRIWLRSATREWRGTHRPVPTALLHARQYVQSHYRKGFTLDALAASCGLSKSHLCRGFKAHFGISPVALAIRIRLDHARELLRNADLNVTQIADECGFSDVYYFSRLFKQRMGMSPRRYRECQ